VQVALESHDLCEGAPSCPRAPLLHQVAKGKGASESGTLDDKKVIDATRSARDECVNWKGKNVAKTNAKPAN
jgi:hypothetical protein